MMMKAITRLLVAPLGLLGACTGPDDGVLSIAFVLESPPPAESRVAPPETDTGVAPLQFGLTRGRCDCDVVTEAITCSFDGLPALEAAPMGPRRYELSLMLWPGPLPAGFDARNIERDPGGHDPDNPPPPAPPPLRREPLGPVLPDTFGQAQRIASRLKYLARVAGGEVHLVVPRADGASVRYLVLDGRTGNLPATTSGRATTAPPPTGTHVH